MNIDVLLKIIDGKYLNKGTKNKIINIKIDSRQINEDDVFIALIGKKYDGHNYIKEAIKKKAGAIIVCKRVNVKTKVPIILVENTYDALLKIGAFFRNKYGIPIIGITGSIGKTTTKEIVSNILSKKYKVLKSEKNYNNHIGIPLTLTKLNNSYDVCVLELGMNHFGEISKLSKMIKPNIGVITKIGTSHIGNLGSKKNILKAKMEIIDGMEDGLLIINNKDKLLKRIKYSNIIRSGQKLKPFSVIVNDKVSFKLVINNEVHKFEYNSLNKDLIMNFVLAIEIGLLFNIPIEDIKDALYNFEMPDGRMNIITKNTTKIINDCYNASLESVISSINVLKNEKNNKIIILGDILELGKQAIKIHKKIGRHLNKLKNTKVFLVGKNVKQIKGKNYIYFDNNEDLIKQINNINLENTTILIKASRKMHLEEITKYIINNL